MSQRNAPMVKWACHFVVLLLVAVQPGFAKPKTATPFGQPEDVVRKLYRQIVKRKPLGIPFGSNKKAIWPLLSRGLIQRLETTRTCESDQMRKLNVEEERLRREHPDEAKMIALKPSTWDEDGLFSGFNEEGIPAAAIIERTEPQNDGSSRVYVKLTYHDTFETGRHPNPADTFSWTVAAVVILEEGHYLVNDVLFFKENSTEIETRLSEMLLQGCDGPKWIGYPERAK